MTEPITARAARYSTFGPASVLEVGSVRLAPPREGQVRLRVHAAGINPFDTALREGHIPSMVQNFPSGAGRELSGTVEAVGGTDSPFSVGDEVFGSVSNVAIADFALAKESSLARRPAELSPVVAATLPLAGLAAWDSFSSQSVTAADTVLVSAAAGGVGVLVAQLALRAGATVLGTASEGNHAFLRELGVIPIGYGPGLVERVREAAPGGVTVVFDNHGDETILAGLELGVSPDRINSIAGDATAHGVRGAGRGPVDTASLDTLAALVVAGELVVPIEAEFPLDSVAEAFTLLERGHLRGKIVVVL